MPAPRFRRSFANSLKSLRNKIRQANQVRKRETDTQLHIERLEERQMLAGDLVPIFQTSFEEIVVPEGGYQFTQEIGGFKATAGDVELQHDHPSVGPASDGNNLLELDGVNGIFVELENLPPSGLKLQVDYSPRPGFNADLNTIEVLWNGNVIETMTENGRRNRTTKFRTVEVDIPGGNGMTTGRLEFRSVSPDDLIGTGGLIDNVRVLAEQSPIAISPIADQDVSLNQTITVDADLAPPDQNLSGVTYSLVNGPVGATINAQTGVVTWTASQANIDASAGQSQTTVGPRELLFQAGFEDVDVEPGGYGFFQQVSGFTSIKGSVEIQDNHPAVGRASEGSQHLELDVTNGIFRNVSTVDGDRYELVFDYSPRPGVNPFSNTIEVWWDGQLLDSVTADGRGNRGTEYQTFTFDLSNFSGDLTRLEFRSNDPDDKVGLGGLIDNVRVFRRKVTVVDPDKDKFNVTVRATDSLGRTDTESFNFCILDQPVDQPPVFQQAANRTINELQPVEVFLTATDSDTPDDQLRFEAIKIPVGATLDEVTGKFSWTPNEWAGGFFFNIDVKVTDTTGLSDTQRFRITVNEVNVDPMIQAIEDIDLGVGQALQVNVVATDADRPLNTLQYSLSQAPTGAKINQQGQISWQPTAGQTTGTFDFEVEVTDGAGGSDTEMFQVRLGENTAPVLAAISDQEIDENTTFSIQASATDPEVPPQTLTYSLVAGPDTATINPQTGLVTWNPLEADGPGEYTFTVRVIDGAGGSDERSFQVLVAEVNTPPVLAAIPNQNVQQGQQLQFTVTATDADVPANQLTYGLSGSVPSGASINPTTGVFTWTPNNTNAPGTYQVNVTVSDGQNASDMQTVSIMVTAGDSILLRENNDFESIYERSIVVDENNSTLKFQYARDFDFTDDFVNDAFEVALLDEQGNSLVHTIAPGRDAYFNFTESQSAQGGVNTVVLGGTIKLDLSHIAPGTTANLVFRLVNNDTDTGTIVRVFGIEQTDEQLGTPVGASTSGDASPLALNVDPTTLTDVTQSLLVNYGGTSYDADSSTLFANVQLDNLSTAPIDGPFVLVVSGISDPTVSPVGTTGRMANGDRYYVIGPNDGDNTLAAGESTKLRTLRFFNPNQAQFDFDLRVLAQPNRSPEFVSSPNREGTADVVYQYDAVAEDPDGDSLTYTLMVAPEGMAIGAGTGKITWSPDVDDVGTHSVFVQVVDGRGGRDTQSFDIEVLETRPNRPPIITSTPVVETVLAGRATQSVLQQASRQNLIFNGDFEQGDIGFRTDLAKYSSDILDLGQYAIVTSPSTVHPLATDYTDNSGDGLMMAVNGSDQLGSVVWEQTVAVERDTDYDFASWISNWFPTSPANLEFAVNGEMIGTLTAPELTGIWVPFFATWNSGNATTATIQIRNSNQAFEGNDFALDDIYFGAKLYSEVASNYIEFTPPAVGSSEASVFSTLPSSDPTLFGFPANSTVVNFDVDPFGNAIASGSFLTTEYESVGVVMNNIQVTSSQFGGPASSPNTTFTPAIPGEGMVFNFSVPMQAVGFINTSPDQDLVEFFDADGNLIYSTTDQRGEIKNFNIDRFIGYSADADRPIASMRVSNNSGNLELDELIFAPVEATYEYQVVASDPDMDPIRFQLDESPVGMIINSSTGLISWAPNGQQVGTHHVVVTASDGRGGVAVQEYDVRVLADPTNSAPSIVSDPVDDFFIPGFSNPASGDVSTQRISLDLGNGETFEGTVSITLPADTARFADIVISVDESSSMGGDQAWVAQMIPLLDDALIAQGIGSEADFPNRFAVVGFGGGRDGVTVGHFLNPERPTVYTLYGPSGDVVSEGALNAVILEELLNLPLPADGDYILVVKAANQADLENGVDINIGGETGDAVRIEELTVGDYIDDRISLPGQPVEYRFELTAPDLLYFDSQSKDDRIRWTLRGPEGAYFDEIPFSRALNGFTDPVVSALPGFYQLTIDSPVDVAADYQFRLLNLNDSPQIASGVPQTITFETNRETKVFQFEVGDGQQVSVDQQIQSTVHPGSEWKLIDAGGNLIHRSAMQNDLAPFRVDAGKYFLLLESELSPFEGTAQVRAPGVVVTTVEIVDVPASLPITIGEPTTATLGFEQDFVDFSISVPEYDFYSVDSLSNVGSTWEIIDRNDIVLQTRRFDQTDSFANQNLTELAPGEYIFRVRGNGNSGDVSFRILNFAFASDITPGTSFDGDLTPGQEVDFYRFDATEGETLFINAVSKTEGSLVYRLYDQYGNEITENRNFTNTELNIPRDGTYILTVEGYRLNTVPLDYTFNVIKPVASIVPLSLDTVVDGTMGIGEQSIYTFSLAEDRLLYFDALSNDANIRWSLEGPSGRQLVTDLRFTQSDSADRDNAILDARAGDYRLTIDGIDARTGDFSFVLLDLAAAEAISPNPGAANPSVIIDAPAVAPNQTKILQFDALSGDEFSLITTLNGANQSYYRVVDQFGVEVIGQTAIASDNLNVNFINGGTYYLLLEGRFNDTTVEDYEIEIAWIQNNGPRTTSGTAINFGDVNSGSLDSAGQDDSYTFTLTDRSLFYFDALTNNSNIRWQLDGPQGIVVSNLAFSSSDSFDNNDPVYDLPAGDYELRIFGNGTPGAYEFRVLDLADGTSINYSTPFNGQLDLPSQTNLYQFDATAGDRLFVDVLAASDTGNILYRVYDRFGTVVLQQSSMVDNGNLEIPADGTYYLLVEGWRGNTGLDTYEMELVPIVNTLKALELGNPIRERIETIGASNSYQFTLAERTPIAFDSLTSDFDHRWQLEGPEGTIVASRRFDISDANSGVQDVFNLRAGDYTLTVTGPVGSGYHFRLIDLTALGVVAMDTPLDERVDAYADVPPAWTEGVFAGDAVNGGLDMTSDLAAIRLPNEVLDGHPNHTIEFWYKTSKTGFQSLISAAVPADDNRVLIHLNSDTDFRFVGVGTWIIDSVADDQWHHYALSSEGGVGTTFYLDGVSQGTVGNTRTSLDLTDGAMYFGHEQDAVDNRIDRTQAANGVLDELRFWSVARSETEIVDNLGMTVPVDSAGLTAYYKLDETSGSVASDSTANGLDASAAFLSPNQATQAYAFDVEDGQSILIDLRYATGFQRGLNMQLVDSEGRRLSFTSGQIGPVELAPGRYYFLLEGEANDFFAGGRYGLEFSVVSDDSVPNDPVDLNLDEVIQGELLKRYQTDRYAFSLSGQTPLSFDSLTDSSTLTWSIVKDGVTLIDSRRFDLSDAFDRDDSVFVLSPGDYELQVSSPQREAYGFKLLNLLAAQVVAFDENLTDIVIEGSQSRAFQFSAAESESIFVDFANATPNVNLAVKLFDSTGKLLFNNDRVTDMDTIPIERSGVHYLLLESWPGSGETTLDFTVTQTVTTSLAMPLDQEIVGSLAKPGDRFEYTFELTEGQRLYFDSLSGESNFVWSLKRDNASLYNNIPMNRAVSADPLPEGVMLPGQYTLTIDGVGDMTGEFAFRMLRIDSASALDMGTAAGELTRGNETDLFRFDVDAGDTFFFDVTVAVAATEYRLMNSLGNTVARYSSLTDQLVQFEYGGQYTLLVEGRPTSTNDGQAYSIDVIEIAVRDGGGLAIGTPVTGSIESAGDRVAYQFELTNDTYLHFDRLIGDNTLLWSLTGPRGEQVSSRRFDLSDSNATGGNNEPAAAFDAMAGSYTLTVAGAGDATGDFSFVIYDLMDDSLSTEIAPILGTPATIDSIQTDPLGTQIYRFQAEAGDTFSFDTTTTGSIASDYKLIDQYGQQIFESYLNSDVASVLLARAGTYYLLVEGRSNNADVDEYQIVVSLDSNTPQPGFSGTAIDLDVAQTGSIDAGDQVDRYTFTLTDRTLAYMDGLSGNTDVYWTLRGPRGIEINSRRLIDSDSFRSSNPTIDLLAGDYELSMFSTGSPSGAYGFMLRDLASATPVAFQTPINGEFTNPAETDLYRIDATEATDLFVDVVSNNDVNAGWIRIVDQFGSIIGTSNRMRDNSFLLPSAGTYYMLVEGTYNNGGNDVYQLFLAPPTINQANLNIGVNQGDLAIQNTEFEYAFDVTERTTLFMLPTTQSAQIHWSIESDAGVVFTETNFNAGARLVQLEAGSYTLVVDGDGETVGEFDFTIVVGNGAAGLGLNGEVSTATLDQNSPVTAFRFSGSAGDQFSLVSDLSVLFTDSVVAAATASNYATGAQPEDGYSGIDVALRTDLFRDGAAINYIMVTDEDRDNEEDNVTFETLFAGLSGQSALLNVVVASQFRDENNSRAIGVDYQGNAYLADGNGGFTVSSGGFASTSNISIKNDYVDLAWALNGASWDLGLLRAGGFSAESFTNAFIDVKVDEILKQTALRLFPSDQRADFEWINPDDGIYLEPIGSQTYDFEIRIGESGQPISYDLIFSQGQTIGSIPVFVISPYAYGAAAVDPDGDQLTWSLVQAPEGMAIDSNTGRLAWTAASIQYGEHQITIRVDDGRGGFDQQTFLLNVNGGVPASISGLVLDVDTINEKTVGVIVPGTSDPWLAGMPDGSTASSGDVAPDHSPVLVEDLDFIPGTEMTFSATGWSNFNGSIADSQTPDGTSPTTHGNGAENGISDYKVPIDALVGVFLTDALPTETSAPDALNFIDADGVPGGINYTAIAPELQQVFFIGDGVNDEGERQTVTIPEGATRLYLGTSDGFGWFNNSGFFEVEVTARSGMPQAEDLFTVFLDQNRNGLRDSNEVFTTTDALGEFSFENLSAGSYVVRTEALAGYRPLFPVEPVQEISVGPGEAVENTLFRFEQVPLNNTNPEITSLPPTRIEAGTELVYTPTVVELDGDDLRFDLPLAPAGMVVNSQNGSIRWTPNANQVGIQNVLLRVRDDFGGFDLQYFQIEVLERNTAPVITSVAPTGPAGVGLPYQYDVNALDANGDTVEYSLVDGPDGMAIDAVSGLLRWTPGASQVGSVDVTVRAADGRGLSSDQSFTLSVELAPENSLPEFVTEPPTSVRLGDQYLYRVGILDINGDPLTLELIDGPGGMTLDEPTQLLAWQPNASQLGSNEVTLRLSDGRGGVVEQVFSIEVETQPVNFPPQITTPPVTVAIADQPYEFDADAIDANNDTLVWTLEQAPTGMTVDPLSGKVTWSPTTEDIGSHQVILQVIDPSGAFAQVVYTLRVRAINSPPVVLTTPPTLAAVGSSYLYQVGAEDADQDRLTFTLLDGPGGMSINADTGLVEWSPTEDQVGVVEVAIRVSDPAGGFAEQTYTIQVADGTDNRLPVITSTPGFFATLDQLYEYQVEAADPDGDPLVFEFINGPEGAMIDMDTGLFTFTPDSDDLGTTIVQLAARDPSGGGSLQSFSLTVLEDNNAPVINSTPPTELASGQAFRYDVLATDADGDFLTYALVEGPDGMVIDGVGRMFWVPSADQIGDNEVRVRVSDPRGGFAEQAFTLTVAADTEAPRVAILLSDNPVDVGSFVDIRVTSVDNVGVEELMLTIDGEAVPLDSDGRARIELDTVGSVLAVATATDAAGNQGTDEIEIFVADPNDVDGPVISIATPGDGDTITAPTDVIGSVNDDTLVSYTLYLGDFETRTFTEIGSGNANVDNGVLGTIDSTLLQNNSYILRLEAVDAGGQFSVIEQSVEVTGELKLGNFSVAFSDMLIPVNGFPLTITRSYNSLDASQLGDFGYGWNLDFRDVKLQVSVPESGLEDYGIYSPFRSGTRVYLTLPGGERAGFTFTPDIRVLPGLGNSLVLATPRFTADPGVNLKLSVQGGNLFINEFGELSAGGGVPWNPLSPDFGGGMTVTEVDGTTYRIDGGSGKLTEIKDTLGNSLNLNDNGVTSDSGIAIDILRDSSGRITSIVGPTGETVSYAYDSVGDLVSVTDANGAITEFSYLDSPAHYLDRIEDSLDRPFVRLEYDDSGRLVASVDADGNRTEISHDASTLQQVVTDALGNTTVIGYDDRGNVVFDVDANGAQTTREYDNNNNPVKITDANGNVQEFTYDDRGLVLSEKDEAGFETRFNYNALGATTASIDPLGNTTQIEYTSTGVPTVWNAVGGAEYEPEYDSKGNLTGLKSGPDLGQSVYDSAGNLVSQSESQNGFETSIEYDESGRPTKETITDDGVDYTTEYTYDPIGNLIRVDRWDGASQEFEYDAVGNLIAETDFVGNTTRYVYDNSDRVITIIYPDATPEDLSDNPRIFNSYDSIGRLISTTDEGGFVTRFEYDSVGRLTTTIFPDSTPADITDNPRISSEYDAIGNLTAEVDELGNRTVYTYDSRGNQVSVIDAAGNETRFEYDELGNLVKTIDPLGRETRFQFDEFGREVGVEFADGTSVSKEINGNFSIRSSTNASGETVQFETDTYGRITGVIDELGGVLSFGFDALGNTTYQVDPNGNVTNYEFDVLGRQISATLPLGQTESRIYDGNGRVTSVVDFNGDETVFVYDARGNVDLVTFAVGSTADYAYSDRGLLVSVVDSAGTTTFEYDERQRLISRTDVFGRTASYTYDLAGNIIQLDAGGDVVGYTYDALNRLTSVVEAGSAVAQYTYDAVGNLVGVAFSNGTSQSRDYDVVNRVTSITDVFTDGAESTVEYAYDPNGRIVSSINDDGTENSYSYDELGRLLTEEKTESDGSRIFLVTYSYDESGNRLTKIHSVDGSTSYSYDENNRLVTLVDADGTREFTYDDAGNLLTVELDGTVVTQYVWDVQGRLIEVDVDGDGVTDIEKEYDYSGNLISETSNGQTIEYLVDINRQYPQIVAEYINDIQAAKVVHGLGPVSQMRGGETSIYHLDQLGSVHFLSDSDGLLSDSYRYDAFGELIGSTGGSQNTTLFAGERLDPVSGLYFLRSRHYNPGLGRFVSQDAFNGVPSLSQSLNRFAYVLNDPVNLTDPSGFAPGSLIETSVVQGLQRLITKFSGLYTAYKAINTAVDGLATTVVLVTAGAQFALATYALTSTGTRFGSSKFVLVNVKNPVKKGWVKQVGISVSPKGKSKADFSFDLEFPGEGGVKFGAKIGVNLTSKSAPVSFKGFSGGGDATIAQFPEKGDLKGSLFKAVTKFRVTVGPKQLSGKKFPASAGFGFTVLTAFKYDLKVFPEILEYIGVFPDPSA